MIMIHTFFWQSEYEIRCSSRMNMQIFSVTSFSFLDWSHNYCQMWIFFSKKNCTCRGEASGLPATQCANYTGGEKIAVFPTCAEFAGFRPDFQHRLVGLSPRLNHPKGRTGCLLRLVINTVLFDRGALQLIRLILVIYFRTESPQCLVIAAPAVPF